MSVWYLRPALQPVSVHVLAFAFCNNPVHAQVTTTDSRQLQSIIKARKHVSSHSYTCCDVSGTSGRAACFTHVLALCSAITLCVRKVTQQTADSCHRLYKARKHVSGHFRAGMCFQGCAPAAACFCTSTLCVLQQPCACKSDRRQGCIVICGLKTCQQSFIHML
jgi:hypothetical protein